MREVFEKIIGEFEKRISGHLRIMAGLGDRATRYGYVKTLEAYQQGKMIVEAALDEYNDGWIPVGERLPDDKEVVQVTFIGYHDHAPYCDAFAYRRAGKWYWSLNDEDVDVEITAWKKNCEPYREN